MPAGLARDRRFVTALAAEIVCIGRLSSAIRAVHISFPFKKYGIGWDEVPGIRPQLSCTSQSCSVPIRDIVGSGPLWSRLAFMASLDVGHGGTYSQPNGGLFGVVGVEWLQWQLKSDSSAAKMFTGPACGLCVDPRWTVQQKLIPGL
jgi:hypothetical protein